jgi:hypothetical protein
MRAENLKATQVETLTQMGFLPETQIADIERAKLIATTALSAFQEFCGLPITGVMDDLTTNAMNRPRCGNPMGFRGIGLEFVLGGTVWPGARITYGFDNFNGDLPHNRQQQLIRDSFAVWEGLVPLRFLEVPIAHTPDIRILWAAGNHGLSAHNAFDGPGKVLAHAFYPPPNGPMAGDIHFDEDEQWTDNPAVGFHLLWVAVHEIGHALGLDHTDMPNSIMQPFYPCNQGVPSSDDRLGIRTAYREHVWIEFLYRDLLGRAPDIEGLDLLCRVRNSGTPAPKIVDGLLRSAEYCTRIAARFYRTLLNREPDAAGLEDWKNVLMQGASFQAVTVGFCDSQEFKSIYPVPGQFVEALYKKLLKRQPDPDGYAGWVNAINSGMSTANVIRGFLTSDEYAGYQVTEFYRTYLHRAPEPQGFRDWTNAVRRGVSMQDIIRGFVASDEYRNAVITR